MANGTNSSAPSRMATTPPRSWSTVASLPSHLLHNRSSTTASGSHRRSPLLHAARPPQHRDPPQQRGLSDSRINSAIIALNVPVLLMTSRGLHAKRASVKLEREAVLMRARRRHRALRARSPASCPSPVFQHCIQVVRPTDRPQPSFPRERPEHGGAAGERSARVSANQNRLSPPFPSTGRRTESERKSARRDATRRHTAAARSPGMSLPMRRAHLNGVLEER
ncbi:hypothetical protein G5714_021829 [Onychostoma macrolepis]|uniref:Uncharacterized protein n=1 Tax=Onychostoma macrolepis TaxID=369639 RepID=A0A7J6BSU6_9TELE|nr:hypothetical protein G5714_021829 [Onychostoma macrolepis]